MPEAFSTASGSLRNMTYAIAKVVRDAINLQVTAFNKCLTALRIANLMVNHTRS